MGEPLDGQSRAFGLIAERFAQELDKPHALFDGLLLVILSSYLRAIFVARHRTDNDIVAHKSPRSEKL